LTWELRSFEEAISMWKKDLERKSRVPVEGAEDRIRSWKRSKRLTWMHNIMGKQTSITEFMFPIKTTNTGVSVEVAEGVGQIVASGQGVGVGTGLGSGLRIGRAQSTSGPTRRVQDRIEHRTQRKIDRYIKKAVDPLKEMDSSTDVNPGRVVPGHFSWYPGENESRRQMQIDSGPLDVSEREQNIEEDQVRIREDIASAVTQSQAILEEKRMSRIKDNKQIELARREEERKLVETSGEENRAKRKKDQHAAEEKAFEKSANHKRKRDESTTIQVVRSGDRKRKKKRVECRNIFSLGGRKKKRVREESHTKTPKAEGKRKKTEGKDGCNQLGSSTHKGIS
jgi:hypothetical protein